jgi:glycosyltransferase involved in cell wall biosynthesis
MLTTSAPSQETKGNVEIHRIEWLRKLFYKVEPYPILDFLYLTPRLLVATFFFLMNHKIKVVHAQGINAACIAILLQPVFKTKVVVSTHALYEFQGETPLAKITREIFIRADTVLSLLNRSKTELIKLGIPAQKIQPYTYWIDQNQFTLKDKTLAKNEIKWDVSKKHILFIGRLIEKKGVMELVKATHALGSSYRVHIIGSGPLEDEIRKAAQQDPKILFHGKVDNNQLPAYYQAADIFIIPSTHEEGAGRVIMESLACGTPVIGANRGGIPEIVDTTVGDLIDITPENIVTSIQNMNERILNTPNLSQNCRIYAEKHFSVKNADIIIQSYENVIDTHGK